VRATDVKNVRLVTDRLQIRDLPPSAAGRVARFHADNWEFHRPWEPHRHPAHFTARTQRAILRSERRSDSALHLWLLVPRAAGEGGWRSCEIIGSVTLSAIIRGFFQSCYLGYKMDARYARQGYMSEAIRSVVWHAFGPLGLHRIEANVMPRNSASLGLLRSLGFAEEGCGREYLKIQGVWEDHVHMVLLNRRGAKNSPWA
jgi:ribosomal-protein-alanine N-acetyltransferase